MKIKGGKIREARCKKAQKGIKLDEDDDTSTILERVYGRKREFYFLKKIKGRNGEHITKGEIIDDIVVLVVRCEFFKCRCRKTLKSTIQQVE